MRWLIWHKGTTSTFLLFLKKFFRAAPVAYVSSQPRSPIGAAAAGQHHSHSHSNFGIRAASVTYTTAHGNAGSQPSEKDQRSNYILMDTSWVHYCCTTMATSTFSHVFCLLVFAAPVACQNSWDRDRTHATAATQAAASDMLDLNLLSNTGALVLLFLWLKAIICF